MAIWRAVAMGVAAALAVGGPAMAEDAADDGAQARDTAPVMRLMDGMPDATLRRVKRWPKAFLRDSAELILGYGGDKGIDRRGIERYIGLTRADLRSRAMARLMRGDLDNDGWIDADELAFLVAAASASNRAKLTFEYGLADADRDGRVSPAELRRFGQEMALDKLSEDDADDLLGFMVFDLDGDAHVTLEEVRAALRQMEINV